MDQVLSVLRQAGVAIPHPDQVADYLARHFDLGPVLPPIFSMVRREFSGADTFALDVFEDEEAEDEYLTLYVRQETYAPDIMPRLEKLWAAYGPALENKSGWFLVTTDFSEP